MSADGVDREEAPVNLSGILVVASPERLDAVSTTLAELPGVDVHQSDPETGRMVVTQEAPDVAAEVAGLKRIKSLPDVIMAEMVVHWFADDAETHTIEDMADLPEGLGSEADRRR